MSILRLKRSTPVDMRMPPSVTLIYRKTSEVGLLRDVEMISSVIDQVRHADPLEPPVATDLAIHLEVPAYVWMPWARKNVLMVNPELWPRAAKAEEADAWSSYLPRFDALIFKCSADIVTFCKDDLTLMNKCFVVPWASAAAAPDAQCNSFSEALTTVLTPFLHLSQTASAALPPYLSNAELPSISIVTLTYNRRKFLDLCFLNLLSTDYPKEKIEWVVVDDSDDAENQGADKIMKFGRQCAPISLTYLPLAKKTSIGAKRNLGCLRAQHGIILMMDDDDHYPPSSFRRRVAWLMHEWVGRAHSATVATTIATYSLTTGVSAVNTPPLSLPLRQRISEATLTFSKSFWEERGFPEVSLAEGEGFLAGREGDVLEMPANQIIVAMSHGSSASQRRVPEGKPGCFWGFDPEFLTFLHGLAGVAVESEAEAVETHTTEMD